MHSCKPTEKLKFSFPKYYYIYLCAGTHECVYVYLYPCNNICVDIRIKCDGVRLLPLPCEAQLSLMK